MCVLTCVQHLPAVNITDRSPFSVFQVVVGCRHSVNSSLRPIHPQWKRVRSESENFLRCLSYVYLWSFSLFFDLFILLSPPLLLGVNRPLPGRMSARCSWSWCGRRGSTRDASTPGSPRRSRVRTRSIRTAGSLQIFILFEPVMALSINGP